jgi:serine protease Do
MRKAIYAGGILAMLVAVALVGQTHAAAQNQNRLAIQGDVLSLVGPGSSIGITVRDSDSGVVVQSVRTETPASRAGVKEGDIVTEFDGERARSAAQFTRLVRETAPGRAVKMTVLRSGTAMTLDISPENRGADGIQFPDIARDVQRGLRVLPPDFNFDFADPGFPFNSSRRLGVFVTPLSDQLAAYFGVKQGVLVTEVAAGSVAEAAGIKAGDVITTVRGQTIASSADVVRELGQADSGASVEIRVTRNHKEVTVTAKMPERTRANARRGARAI